MLYMFKHVRQKIKFLNLNLNLQISSIVCPSRAKIGTVWRQHKEDDNVFKNSEKGVTTFELELNCRAKLKTVLYKIPAQYAV